jgi:nicotinamide-nucleotide amidase
MFSNTLIARATRLLKACGKRGIMLAGAESCTGGLIAALLTEIPGSSAVFERGFVTYSNAAKTAQLGVPEALIKRHGAVSAQVAKAMAEGALAASHAQITVAVTGIAGPTGGTKLKPVGLVYIAVAGGKAKTAVKKCNFTGGRSSVRLKAVTEALRLLSERTDRYS